MSKCKITLARTPRYQERQEKYSIKNNMFSNRNFASFAFFASLREKINKKPINLINISYSCSLWVITIFLFINFPIFAQQNTEAARRDIIQFGTETEIASLIQALRSENADFLDDELIALIANTRNQRILTGVFGFFGEREKSGLEERAIRAIVEREDETNETVLSAIDYIGRLKPAEAVPVIIELLNTEESRFMNGGFRALGRAGAVNREVADEAADFLVDFYTYREPAADSRSIIITAIGETGSSLGVPLLVDIATNTDERFPLRVAALGALSKIGDEEGVEAILSNVTTNDPNVRSAAVAALGPFSGEAVDRAILDGFRDSFYRTRIAAAQASRERKLVAAVPFLRFRAERDDVPTVRDEAIRALGAIANEEAIETLDNLFSGRRNTDRVRILSGEMLMKNTGDKNFNRLIIELDEAKRANLTNLYNGLLKIVGETVIQGEKTEIENVAMRFIREGTVIERLYALDMAANNNLTGLREHIITLTKDRNESLARRARRTAEQLGIEIPENEEQ
ncbi:MAG: HEAT repeat domain-containing protein [Treponema sp.]|jgi:HEAT repeat protein|nr:HEAT repeat domain-containing protein [Treponema sp.]